MDTSYICRVCNEQGHSPMKCPALRDALKEGFYSGGGGGGGHDHDEDECLETKKKNLFLFMIFTK